jgi:hypothetical protein
MTRRAFGLAAAFTAMAVGGACTDTTGTLNSTDTGSVEVTLQRASVQLAPAADFAVFLSDAGLQGKVDPSSVDSLFVTVTSIGFLPVEAEDTGEESEDPMWMWLDLPDPVTLDLLALPTEGDSPIVIAAGDVPVGDYRKVRMIVGGAAVFFNQAMTVGQAAFDVDTEYPVDVPSGAQSGLKTDATFSVVGDDVGDPTAVNLLFDPDATFKNVTATGSGKVKLAPVIKVR